MHALMEFLRPEVYEKVWRVYLINFRCGIFLSKVGHTDLILWIRVTWSG